MVDTQAWKEDRPTTTRITIIRILHRGTALSSFVLWIYDLHHAASVHVFL